MVQLGIRSRKEAGTNGEDTQYIEYGMGSRREEYEHQAAKKGCSSLDGTLRPNVHSSAQSGYYR